MTLLIRVLLLIAYGLFFLSTGTSALVAATLTAGVARIDITPPLEMQCPLGGYGERMNKPAEGIHDRIWAKAIVLTDGTQKFAIITADLLGFPFPFKEELVREVKSHGWESNQMMLLASHSHASIEMNAFHPGNTFGISQIGIYNPQVHQFTLANFKKLLLAADRQLQEAPVKVRIGTSRIQLEGWNNNRRKQGFTDNDLTLTRIDTATGKPMAVLVNFTAHPTFMSSRQMWFSAGWPGHLQRTLETLIGDEVTVMYYNGAEGDQSPRSRPHSGESRWEKAERYGVELAAVSHELWMATGTESNVEFRQHTVEFDLPPANWHPDFMQTGGKEYGLSTSLLQQMIPKLFAERSHCTTVQIGQLSITGIPGEMAAGMGAEIKRVAGEKLSVESPTIGGLADAWISYILTEEAWETGGYEASVSFYGPQLGPVVKQAALESFPLTGP
ncbi:Neutral/alkaline non-lysosomal ceramidase [Polystyrenella longa]|uniref:Neutral ceramidase n=1 Tax=Polystyrenella longa TaxID=2528007 RepID=A0A518CNW7_9PLAN|nr:neutral/alkaline non-lysosomal ceramidase N-terminal domain-containing protein [Polystyrenella longa]QDU80908.1 Neutral/alkaline non-lysosomal ceramidase [Polystyrenella longa]